MTIKIAVPELPLFMEEKVSVYLSTKKMITGYLRGYDQFLNLVVELLDSRKSDKYSSIIIRGGSIVSIKKSE